MATISSSNKIAKAIVLSKPSPRNKALVIRTNQEAWALALKHKGLVYSRLSAFVRSHSTTWYSGDDLRRELESYAWEGMYKACRLWDSAKGTLTTYAYPSIESHMIRGIQILARNGGNLKNSSRKSKKPEHPQVYSLDALSESQGNMIPEVSASSRDGAENIKPQPWQDSPEGFEDALVDKLNAKTQAEEVYRILENMSEPHKTVFRLIHLTPPTHERKTTFMGEGWTLKEVANYLGRNTTIVRQWLDEAEEYIRFHLESKDSV